MIPMTQQIKNRAFMKKKNKEKITIPTGTDLMNLVVGKEGFPGGKVANVIGDSSAGKTFVVCETIYSAKKKYGKDRVKVRYNDCESGFTFDTLKMYGFDIREDVCRSDTIQDFSADLGNTVDELDEEDLLIYVVDSFDGLCTDADLEEFDNRKKAAKEGKKYDKGSYDMGKQKYSSKFFRTICGEIEDKNVLLIIISQVRDNVTGYGENYKVSGGRALQFYCTVRVFLKSIEFFSKKGRKIGYCVNAYGKKTRSDTPFRDCYLNVSFDYGFDNISSNIDFLFDLKSEKGILNPTKARNVVWDEGEEVTQDSVIDFLEKEKALDECKKVMHIKKALSQKKLITFILGGTLKVGKEETDITPHKNLMPKFRERFGEAMSRDALVHYIEDNDLENELSRRAIQKWEDIEASIKVKRKKKGFD